MKRNLKEIFEIVDLANDIAHAKIGKEREVWEFLGLINCETLSENLYETGYRRASVVWKEAARDTARYIVKKIQRGIRDDKGRKRYKQNCF